MITINIIKGVANVMSRWIIGEIKLTEDALKGDTTVTVNSTRHYLPNDPIRIFVSNDNEQISTFNIVECIVDTTTLQLVTPLAQDYVCVQTKIQKTLINKLYEGDPPVKPLSNSIAVTMPSIDREPLTLESVTEDHSINITCYAEGKTFTESFERIHNLTDRAKTALFLGPYLIEPFGQTTLTNDAKAGDPIIQVDDPDELCRLGFVMFDNGQWLRDNRIIANMQNGVFQLASPIGRPFPAGTCVILPHVFPYDIRVEHIEFTPDAGNVLKKRSEIDMSIKIETRRHKANVRGR